MEPRRTKPKTELHMTRLTKRSKQSMVPIMVLRSWLWAVKLEIRLELSTGPSTGLSIRLSTEPSTKLNMEPSTKRSAEYPMDTIADYAMITDKY